MPSNLPTTHHARGTWCYSMSTTIDKQLRWLHSSTQNRIFCCSNNDFEAHPDDYQKGQEHHKTRRFANAMQKSKSNLVILLPETPLPDYLSPQYIFEVMRFLTLEKEDEGRFICHTRYFIHLGPKYLEVRADQIFTQTTEHRQNESEYMLVYQLEHSCDKHQPSKGGTHRVVNLLERISISWEPDKVGKTTPATGTWTESLLGGRFI